MLSRNAPRLLRAGSAIRASPRTSTARQAVAPLCRSYPVHPRAFTSSAFFSKGLQPDSENPKPSNPQSTPVAGTGGHISEPSSLTPEEFHNYSDHYFNVLLAELEKAQEEGSDVEAEYSVSDTPDYMILSKDPSCQNRHSMSKLPDPVIPCTNLCPGRRHQHHRPRNRHLRPEQATPQQADLAQLSHLRA